MLERISADSYYYIDGGLAAQTGAWTIALRTAVNDAEQLAEQRLPAWLELRIIDERPVLFAFAAEQRRKMFRQLLTVSGIGPESALLVLELGTSDEILLAVAGQDQSFFQQVPGLGPARIKALLQALRTKNSLPPALPIPVIQWRLVQQHLPEISAEDPRLEQLVGCRDQQLVEIISTWEQQ